MTAELRLHDSGGGRVYRLDVSSPAEWPAELDAYSRHFGLFVAMDADDVTDEELERIAGHALASGAAFISTWGPGCERVHDAFDCEIVSRDLEQSQSVILTTWHAEETLVNALEYFLNVLSPSEDYEHTCDARIVASIGSANLGGSVDRALDSADRWGFGV
jgi:hypothetical protein